MAEGCLCFSPRLSCASPRSSCGCSLSLASIPFPSHRAQSLEIAEDESGTPAPEANTIKLPSISAGPPKKSGRKRERATTASDFDDEEIHIPAQTSSGRKTKKTRTMDD